MASRLDKLETFDEQGAVRKNVAVLWVPWYNHTDPTLFGFPFFYWYQLAWVVGSALITGLVYARTRIRDEPENP